jgi:hypothetical protein
MKRYGRLGKRDSVVQHGLPGHRLHPKTEASLEVDKQEHAVTWLEQYIRSVHASSSNRSIRYQEIDFLTPPLWASHIRNIMLESALESHHVFLLHRLLLIRSFH